MANPKLAVLCDYAEENWPSMDLVAEMLLSHCEQDPTFEATRVCPQFHTRLGAMPFLRRSRFAFNFDRLVNRLWDYPRILKRSLDGFDVFHLCDHSYAQLVHVLPRERTGVFCHDLDTFRCVLEPDLEPRPRWFRSMARHVLRGMEKAALVFYTTESVRCAIERFELVDPSRLVKAPLGIASEFTPSEDGPLPDEVRSIDGKPFLLHVGSCIPRKRIDVLLSVFAEVRREFRELVLVKVGSSWSDADLEQIERLDLTSAIVSTPRLGRASIAALYRRAALVLLPSDAEGFGLPLVEALACGSIVVASDIPVLREVGGDAVVSCPVGDIDRWSETVCHLLHGTRTAPPLEQRLEQARRYTWAEHSRAILNAYTALVSVNKH